MREFHLHHDGTTLTERELKLMFNFLDWVDTVRASPGQRYKPTWRPSEIDVIKSRLFWWIRSGHDPLPYPPPCAFSCPWYELITEEGNHSVYELGGLVTAGSYFRAEANGLDQVVVGQDFYDLIEQVSETEMILGFGPYRFRAFRDIELHADHIAALNPHRPEVRQETLDSDRDNMSRGWFLCRRKDLEGDPILKTEGDKQS